MTKMIVILGQTGTGKSDLAVEISKKLVKSGIISEIISADSRQVYKDLNLGTGKITKREMRGVPHYLLDVVSPKNKFSVNDFQKKAFKKIKELSIKNKIPIICGGTGFYIEAITNNFIFPEVPPNNKLRQKLEKETVEKLFEMLKKLDIKRAQNIDQKNKIRLIRAIEIAKSLGKVPPLHRQKICDSYQILKIGLTLSPEILKEKIRTRLLSRIKKGMIKEVENLHKNGLSWKRMNELGLEYRYISLFLQDKLSKEEMIEKLNTQIWHFAKRQKTWFKRDKSIIWINPLDDKDKQKILEKIKEFLKK